ncbi:hypothetical protein G3578_18405 [Brevibacillus sp. SYP-B805]|uniref:hypothetical protein n=1 Tax=Brevibacillus sp. SYP-B805 TaxID=1578199 RepID=UPI0013EA0DE0|nr:hypothetical protein [Brevibacillus sp. SYP-B805]NGQ97115.1 hypothetical protein [Brevibacillus sp. SYP-B805]
MDLNTHHELLDVLTREYLRQEASITFTQWDTESEDEEVTTFRAVLTEIRLTDNEFGEKDLFLLFEADGDEVEILMEIPAEESDLGAFAEGRLQIFGLEAEAILER